MRDTSTIPTPPKGRNVVSRKCPLGLVNMSPYIFLFVDQSSRSFFSSNVEGVLVDKIFFRFAICRSVPKIFTIKVERCQKSRRIFDVFSPSQILGGEPSENGTHIITPALGPVDWKKFREDTPTSPEVIVAHTLNFRPNFKFSRLVFFRGGGPRPSWGVL